jgi:hypothetical protein
MLEAIAGWLPHGMGVVRLCDLPAEWWTDAFAGDRRRFAR